MAKANQVTKILLGGVIGKFSRFNSETPPFLLNTAASLEDSDALEIIQLFS